MSRSINPGQSVATDRSLTLTLTRRDFLKSTALAAGAGLLHVPGAHADLPSAKSSVSEKLTTGWEYFRGSLGGIWDVWRQDMAESIAWKKVEVPHCFNAYDAVDPDQPYYEGPGWYRRKLQIKNPFEHGRTLLLFAGAGQKCQIFIASKKVGEHVGGYDEFAVDITDLITKDAETASLGRGFSPAPTTHLAPRQQQSTAPS